MVTAGTFREDLFYRLNVITLRVPPLRERPEDIPLLFEHFARKHGAGRRREGHRAAMAKLIAFPWPGNVRQLENEVRRALVLSDGAIDIAELSADIVRGGPSAARGDGPAPALARRRPRVVARPRGAREDPRQPDPRRADPRPLALRAAEDDEAPGGEGRRVGRSGEGCRTGRVGEGRRAGRAGASTGGAPGGPSRAGRAAPGLRTSASFSTDVRLRSRRPFHFFLFPIKSGL